MKWQTIIESFHLITIPHLIILRARGDKREMDDLMTCAPDVAWMSRYKPTTACTLSMNLSENATSQKGVDCVRVCQAKPPNQSRRKLCCVVSRLASQFGVSVRGFELISPRQVSRFAIITIHVVGGYVQNSQTKEPESLQSSAWRAPAASSRTKQRAVQITAYYRSDSISFPHFPKRWEEGAATIPGTDDDWDHLGSHYTRLAVGSPCYGYVRNRTQPANRKLCWILERHHLLLLDSCRFGLALQPCY